MELAVLKFCCGNGMIPVRKFNASHVSRWDHTDTIPHDKTDKPAFHERRKEGKHKRRRKTLMSP